MSTRGRHSPLLIEEEVEREEGEGLLLATDQHCPDKPQSQWEGRGRTERKEGEGACCPEPQELEGRLCPKDRMEMSMSLVF